MPKLETGKAAWTLVRAVIGDVTVALRLELSLVEFVAVVEEELVGRLGTRRDAVFYHFARARRTCQILDLQ